MASTNQSPQYQKAESMFLSSQNDEDKLYWLEEMIRECPKHKSSEKMLANLKTRFKKLKEKFEKGKKSAKGRASKSSIKKEDMQAVIVGFTNSGKSSLLSTLTNTKPDIAPYDFTTRVPIVGMMSVSGTQIQIIEIPAIKSEYYDRGLVNTADVILALVSDLSQIEELMTEISRAPGKKIIIFNAKDSKDTRKLEATLKSKRYNFFIADFKSKEKLVSLKEKIFSSFGKLRIFTKEPGKEKSKNPMILNTNATIKDIARKVLKNLSYLKETRIWGPSSKFAGQVVGLSHKLKDLDVVEFKTR